jgi:hypothetical protein
MLKDMKRPKSAIVTIQAARKPIAIISRDRTIPCLNLLAEV